MSMSKSKPASSIEAKRSLNEKAKATTDMSAKKKEAVLKMRFSNEKCAVPETNVEIRLSIKQS